MKIEQISREISDCFFYQYPEKIKEFNWFLRGRYLPTEFEKMVEVYDDFLNSFDFLIKLIRTMEKKENES